VIAKALLLAAIASRLQPVTESSYSRLVKSRAGRVVLVNVWATWCAPCRKEMPELVALEAKYRARGLVLVTISADEPEQEKEALEFLRRHKVPGPAYLRRAGDDDRFVRAVDPQWSGALPALFLYDRSGRLVRSFTGETGPAAVEDAVKNLLR
jgi:thiol-disulfide isomerase/thioredoxin